MVFRTYVGTRRLSPSRLTEKPVGLHQGTAPTRLYALRGSGAQPVSRISLSKGATPLKGEAAGTCNLAASSIYRWLVTAVCRGRDAKCIVANISPRWTDFVRVVLPVPRSGLGYTVPDFADLPGSAEPEQGRSWVPALPPRTQPDPRCAGSGAGQRPNHDRRRGAWTVRGSAGRTVCRSGRQTPGSAPAGDRPYPVPGIHHERVEMPSPCQSGPVAGRGGGVLTLRRAAATTRATASCPGPGTARPGAPPSGAQFDLARAWPGRREGRGLLHTDLPSSGSPV